MCMRFNISEYSVTARSVVAFFMAAMLLGGIYAFATLGKREDSTFTIKSAIVTCSYPGATPSEVEALVSVPLERELRTLGSVYKISSESHFGYARLVVELHPKTPASRIPQLWDELRRRVEAARPLLPEGVGGVTISDDFGDVYGLYYALVSDGGYSWDEMRNYARQLQSALYGVDGVAKVSLSGLQPAEVSILFSASTLAAFDLRPEDIRAAVAGQSDVVGLGVEDAGRVDVELVEGSIYGSIEDIDNQLLMAADGKQYRLGDVARVVRGYSEPAEYILKVDGRRSVGVAVAASADMDVVSVGDAVAAVVASAADYLPAGLEVVALYPENEIAREATNTFVVNLMESVAIVILLVMIAMGWRAGIIVGASLVLSICGTLLLMLVVGEGLNRTSLAGFIIAMGMLVDNAIVVVDNTSRYVRGGMLLRSAAVAGATQPRLGLLAATLIAIISFLPLQLAPSSVAEIIRPLFVVIALSLLLSWLLAITQVPAMSLGMLRATTAPRDGGVAALFDRVVTMALRHRLATVAVAVVLLVGSLVAMRHMPQNFFPQLSKPLFRADVILADGLDIYATQQRLDAMTEWLLAQREVRRVSTTAGGTPPRYYLASGSYANRPNYGNILVETTSADATAAVEARFDEWVSATMPDVWLRSSLFRLSPTPEATIEFGFVGEEVDTLARLTAQAMDVMMHDGRVVNVRNSWGNGVAVWEPRYSQLKAQRIGVSRTSMLQSLQMSTSGLPLATYREEDEAMPILLRMQSMSGELSALETMPLFSRGGGSYALEQAVSAFDFGFEPSVIRRIDGQRVMKAQCDPARGVNAIALLADLETKLRDEIDIPEGYAMRIYGEQESREESNSALVGRLPITLLIIFVILMLLFGNLREPIILLVTLPLIFVGVVAGLVVTGKMFDFFSLLGLLGLVGMSIKNGVILLSRVDELRASGHAAPDAILLAARDRFIPVVVASATTVLGMLPLLFDAMFGSMAATIMGGLIFATLLVLVVLPVVYSFFYRVKL